MSTGSVISVALQGLVKNPLGILVPAAVAYFARIYLASAPRLHCYLLGGIMYAENLEGPLVVVYDKALGNFNLTSKILSRYGFEAFKVKSQGELFAVMNYSFDLLVIEGLTASASFDLLKRMERMIMQKRRMPKVISVIIISEDGRSDFKPRLVGIDVVSVLKDKHQLKEALNVYRASLRRHLFQNMFSRSLRAQTP